jgi:hypothetical protein
LLAAAGGCGGDGASDGGDAANAPVNGAATTTPGDAAGPARAGGGDVPAGQTQRVFTVGDVSFEIPEPWRPEPPTGAMRDAQFRISPPSPTDDGADASAGDGDAADTPGEPGADDAVGRVFTSIGGSIDGNLDRWVAQFVNPEQAEIERGLRTLNGRTVATFRGTGTFDEGRMLGSTGPKDGWMVLGFLVELNSDKPLIVKITGPASTLEPQLDTWNRMVDSIAVSG